MDLLLVPDPQFLNVIGTFAGLLNLLPGSHLFLLEERYAVGKKLGVSLHSIMESSIRLRVSYLVSLTLSFSSRGLLGPLPDLLESKSQI